MKFATAFAAVVALCNTAQASAIPIESQSLSLRSSDTELIQPGPDSRLEKRKGGGGGGGRAGGSSGSSSSSGSSGSSSGSSGSSSGSSGSSSSGGRSGSSSSSSSGGAGSSSSTNTGGRTSSGSGARPAYGNGGVYSGGAAVPYRSGGLSPGGVRPIYFAAPALAFAGIYAYGAYAYPYGHPYSFHNRSDPTNSTNTTLPVTCLCEQYNVCGCDNSTDSSYLTQLVGNGSTSDMDPNLVRVADVNGTRTLVVNGTLANGTTASGGSDSGDSGSGNSGSTSSSSSVRQSLVESSGFYLLAAGVGYTVWFM